MRLSAVLLAGGKSSRMGRDKALLDFEGQLLWRHQLETLRRLTPEEIFLSGHCLDATLETIADEVSDAGPLAGVAAALRRSSGTHLIVLAIDLPKVTSVFLRMLLALCGDEQGVVPRRDGRFEPLAAVYPKCCAALALAALESGNYSMQDFVRTALRQELVLAHEITDDELALFANLNTPADLAAL